MVIQYKRQTTRNKGGRALGLAQRESKCIDAVWSVSSKKAKLQSKYSVLREVSVRQSVHQFMYCSNRGAHTVLWGWSILKRTKVNADADLEKPKLVMCFRYSPNI